MCVENVPDALQLVMIPVIPRAEARVMKVRNGTAAVAVPGEIGGEPRLLHYIPCTQAPDGRRGRFDIERVRPERILDDFGHLRWIAAVHLRRAVEHDDVPAPDIVAVVADGKRRP